VVASIIGRLVIAMPAGMPRDLVLAEFEHTRGRHGGHVSLAAPILGMSMDALSRALFRAKRDGIDVRFINDVKAAKREQRAA
jgi:hypothetical protein